MNAPIGPIFSDAVSALAYSGRIQVEIFQKNWRVVTILQGPNAGLQTKPHPFGGKPYRTISKENGVQKQRGVVRRDYDRVAPFGLRDLKEGR